MTVLYSALVLRIWTTAMTWRPAYFLCCFLSREGVPSSTAARLPGAGKQLPRQSDCGGLWPLASGSQLRECVWSPWLQEEPRGGLIFLEVITGGPSPSLSISLSKDFVSAQCYVLNLFLLNIPTVILFLHCV